MAPSHLIMRMKTPFEIGGKKDTAHMLAVMTRDSHYKYNAMGKQPGEWEVSPTLRPHLAREYAALDAAGKARFRTSPAQGQPASFGRWAAEWTQKMSRCLTRNRRKTALRRMKPAAERVTPLR